MKNLFLGVAFILFATGAFAQKKSKAYNEETRYGIRGGLAEARYSGRGIYDVDYSNNPGFYVTIFGDLGIGKNLLIQPGISFQQKGAKYSTDAVALGSTVNPATLQQNIMQVEIPINLVYIIKTGTAGAFQINVGPYVGYNFYGKNKNNGNFDSTWGKIYSSGEIEVVFGNKAGNDLRNLDYGVNGGLSYKTTDGWILGGNYGYGLANLAPNATSGNKLENRVMTFSVGFAF